MTTDPDRRRSVSEAGDGAGPVRDANAAQGETSPVGEFQRRVAQQQANSDEVEAERAVWQGGYSPKAMVGTWCSLAFISVAMLVGAFLADPGLLLYTFAAVLLLWVAGGLIYAWRRYGYHYELTTQRFVHQAGILTRRTDRIEVIDIDDVSFTQGPIERIFSIGTIVLTSSDRSHPVLSMIGIADVKRVAGLIDDIRRQERRRRSLHIEAI